MMWSNDTTEHGSDRKQEACLKHVAVIMDGNGRWARECGLPRIAGHEAGAKTAKSVVAYATKKGIAYVTLFVFSQENWHRPTTEVRSLMRLLSRALDQDLSFFFDHHIRLRVIGDLSALPQNLLQKITDVQERTAQHDGMTLILALNYSGRWDMVKACRSLVKQVKEGQLEPESVNQETISAALATHGVPDPDLLIRTSGELRISNFFLWQLAYTELYFSSKPWPAFTVEDFQEALRSYASRQRRYGGLLKDSTH